jgi:hypothetical protein
VIYGSSRRNLSDYTLTARKNGFTTETMGCPVMIADDETSPMVEIKVEKPLILKTIKVPQAIFEADMVIALSHTTLHESFPIAATIKNIAMGCAAKDVKLSMHKQKGNIGVQKSSTDVASEMFKRFKGRFWGFNLTIDITEECDCIGNSDLPITPDIGLLVSSDPLALDKATADMLSKYIKIEAQEYWLMNFKAGIGNMNYKIINMD